jgi:Transposase DDE domain
MVLTPDRPSQPGLSLVLSLGARRRRSRSFDLFQEPPRPFSRERSSAQAVRDRCGALHEEGVVGGEAFAVDASIIVADAHRRRSVAKVEDLVPTSSRAVAEYLSVLDDAAFSGETPVEPKVISPTDPAARYTASANSVAGYAYSDDCDACMLKPKCCPNMLARKIARSVHEAARDKVRAIAKTEAYAVSCRERKKVEMLFAHLKRILRLRRLRLRGPNGAKDEFLLAATAQNLRKLVRLIPLPAPVFAT